MKSLVGVWICCGVGEFFWRAAALDRIQRDCSRRGICCKMYAEHTHRQHAASAIAHDALARGCKRIFAKLDLCCRGKVRTPPLKHSRELRVAEWGLCHGPFVGLLFGDPAAGGIWEGVDFRDIRLDVENRRAVEHIRFSTASLRGSTRRRRTHPRPRGFGRYGLRVANTPIRPRSGGVTGGRAAARSCFRENGK